MAEPHERNGCTVHPPSPPLPARSAAVADRGHFQQELVRVLQDDLGGFQLLDQELALAGDAHLPAAVADFVGLDRTGRLVLVLQLQDTRADAALGQALDLAALAEARRSLLERHLARPISPAPCLVVLVGAELPDELVRRVRMVGPGRLWLLESRELRSANGVTTCFVSALEAPAPDRPGDVDGFIDALPGDLSERAAGLVDRLRRLGGAADGRLGVNRTGDGLEWRIGAATLCALGWRGEELVGRVGGGDGAHGGELATFRALSDGAAAEAFLDAALGRFLTLNQGATAPRAPQDIAAHWARN